MLFRQWKQEFDGEMTALGHGFIAEARGAVIGHLRPAGAPQSEVAEALGISKQAVQQLVDDLEAEGIVERVPNPAVEERARIGRELHDVVAHHMSLLAVQAETAPFRITGQSPEAEAEFLSIASVSREALNDMRKLLGLLRADSAEAETAPQPRLADVPALVREAGAELDTAGDLEEVPPLIGVTAYRVVQESLSNARRHARGAEVSVRVTRTDEEVRIEVRNGPSAGDAQQVADDELEDDLEDDLEDEADSESGSEAATESDQDPEPAAGQGIIGMRERVLLVHGDLETGPTANGGFAVTAVLPLESDA